MGCSRTPWESVRLLIVGVGTVVVMGSRVSSGTLVLLATNDSQWHCRNRDRRYDRPARGERELSLPRCWDVIVFVVVVLGETIECKPGFVMLLLDC